MNAESRKAYAGQMLSNPLFAVLMAEIEQAAIDRGVNAQWTDHETRAAAMAEARAVRTFRANLEAMLRDTPKRNGAPA